MVLELAGGTRGHPQETGRSGVSVPPATFGYVGGDGDARPPHLTRQSVSLVTRKHRCGTVYRKDQRVCLPPHLQIPKALHVRIIGHSQKGLELAAKRYNYTRSARTIK